MAANGTAGLAAGQEVLLKDASDPGRRIFVRAGGGDVTNSGDITAVQAELAAAGGNIYALAGNHDGMIKATGSATRDGDVWLTAGSGNVTVSDTIAAKNADGSGGNVEVTGTNVTVAAGAVIDVRGAGNGGTVLIGGDRQGGANPAQDFAARPLANAQTTTIAAGAQILADGGEGGGAGNGGNVVVWSEQQTAFAGAISVTGGAQGGNGGFVEVSSRGTLAFAGTADRRAPQGQAGTLLLDPAGLDIVSRGSADSTSSTLTTGDLLQALAGGNVVLQTDSGNINAETSFSWANASALTLSAFNSIDLRSGVVIANTGGGSVTLRADNTGIGGVSGAGLKTGFGQVKFGAGAQIALSGGTTPGDVSILYDGYNLAKGAFRTTKDYTGDVSLAGGTLTTFELVNDVAQLQAIGASARTLGQNYALGTSFSAPGVDFTPIGRPREDFDGIFDGEGQTITGLTLGGGEATADNLGLFGEIGAFGIVRNLILTQVSVSATADNASAIGMLAGTNLGQVSNVAVSGTISLGADVSLVGGLIGLDRDGSAIASSTASGTVSVGGRASDIGGLVGANFGSVMQSTAAASVTVGGGSEDVGGLVGLNSSGATIASSTASGAVSSTGSVMWVGGLAGENTQSTVTQSAASGSVSVGAGSQDVGGLVGLNSTGATIAASTASGAVFATGSADVGGLVGDNAAAAISQSLATGAVLASNSTDVGGLVGGSPGGGTVVSSFWDTETTGQAASAGGTGATTAQLQAAGAGTPFAALNGGTTEFGVVDGQSFPYLLSQFPSGTAPQVVSGVAPTGAAGQGVTLVANGQVIGSGTVGVNGYYNLLMAPDTIGNGSAILAFLTPLIGGSATTGDAVRLAVPSAATASVSDASIATTVETGLDIAANTVQVTTDSGVPLTSSLLARAAGTATNPGILYAIRGMTVDVAAGVNATFAAGSANIILDDELALSGAGVATLTTKGTITLNQGIQSQASGDAIVLSAGAATGSAFINNAGANALDTPNGRFLVFTDTVGDVAAGGLAADPLYGFSFAAYTPGSLADFGGNRFVYAESETLTVMPGSSTVTYDGRTQTATPSFAITGLVAGDTLAAAVSGAAGFTGGSGRNAGTYGLSATPGTLASDFGYTFAFGTGTFTIVPAPLAVIANNASHVAGTPDPTFTANYVGFVAGENASALEGSLRFVTNEPLTSAPGLYAILPFGLSSDNYRISFVPGVLTVTPGNPPPNPFALVNTNTVLHQGIDPLTLTQLTGRTPSVGSDGSQGGDQWAALLPSLDANGEPLGPILFIDSSFAETGPSSSSASPH